MGVALVTKCVANECYNRKQRSPHFSFVTKALKYKTSIRTTILNLYALLYPLGGVHIHMTLLCSLQ